MIRSTGRLFGTNSLLLAKLPYKLSALEPYISSKTMSFHYDKHYSGYINKVNILIQNQTITLPEIIKTSNGALFNNAAQAWNHEFYWKSLSGNSKLNGNIKELILSNFQSYEKFQEKFIEKGSMHFGSGWLWLVQDSSKKLELIDMHDGMTPIKDDIYNPLITCDLWEHAYYLDYQNDRVKYLSNFLNIINWDFANRNLK